jgi:hypothetical protein
MMIVVLNNSGPISLNIILQLITLFVESLTRDLSQSISVLCFACAYQILYE